MTKDRQYLRVFTVISLAYVVLFYLVPLYIVVKNNNSMSYAGLSFEFRDSDLRFAFLCCIVFLFSFFLANIFIFRYRRVNNSHLYHAVSMRSDSISRIKIVAIIFAVIIIVYNFTVFSVESAYDVRSGLIRGSHLTFFISIVIGSFGNAILLRLDSLHLRAYVLALLFVFIFLALFTASGRFSILSLFVLFFISLFKIKIKIKYLVSALFLFILATPIVFNLKQVIYSVGVARELPNLLDYYYVGFDFSDYSDKFLLNFSHPLLSLLVADQVIEYAGYRFFYDYIQGVLFYLKVFGVDFGNSLTYLNTRIILGVDESVIPPGYIAFGYIQANIFGVAVSGVFYAFVGYLSNFVRNLVSPNSELAIFFFAFTAANSFYHGEMRVMVLTVFLGLLLMFIFSKILSVRVSILNRPA